MSVSLDVLDLTDDAVRSDLGIEESDLLGDDYSISQEIASAAEAAGFDGILAPSAALPGRRTLVVFHRALAKVAPERSVIRLTSVAIRRSILRPALVKAGLPPTFRTYDLRHTHASLLIEDGASPIEIAYRMGHVDGTVTIKVYGQLFEGAQERLTDRLESMRQSSSATQSDVVELAERRTAAKAR